MMQNIDGSILEGGGQILRISVALSVLLQKPIRIHKIRANRSKPGLCAQHLTGLRLARDLCKGILEHDALGSRLITFSPRSIVGGNYIADIQTGGSVTLVLQLALPCLLFGGVSTNLTLKGGTNADLAPPVDYTINVFKPMLQKFGVNFECALIKRGFFKGEGIIHVTIDPVRYLSPIDLVKFGEVETIEGEAYVAGVLPRKMASEMAETAERVLKTAVANAKISIKPVVLNSTLAYGNGAGINLVAKTTTGCYLGESALGKRGVRASLVGLEAAQNLLKSIQNRSCVDQKMQDQLIIFMALAKGRSRIVVGPITSHTKTAMYLSKIMTTATFTVTKIDENRNVIDCDGIGLENINLID